jgi:mannose-6-phosphate isomerase-like protein (cupin superfamily)
LFNRQGVSVIQERVPAGCAEVMHYHQISRQILFILEGEGMMAFKDQSVTLRAGRGWKSCRKFLEIVIY